MNSMNGVPNKLSPDEIFEQAVARLEAGEPIDAILAAYPSADRDELRDFLTIVQATQPIRTSTIPAPSPARRRQAKQNFLAAAAELRSQSSQQQAPAQTVAQPVTGIESPKSAPTTRRATTRHATARRATAEGWFTGLVQTLQGIFTVRTLRLAPIILAVAVVLLSTTTLVTVAQTAVPGDLTYSLKQWIRKHELELAPADQRQLVLQMQELELAEDVRRAALRADTNSTVIQSEDTQVFYGRTGRVLRIGGLTVLDRYQPDANQETFEPMSIEGELSPGATVRLAYQIMPGQSDTVQGISLTVVDSPTTSDESGDSATDSASDAATPEATAPAAATCAADMPADWVAYQVQAGDNLTFIANRGGVTVDELMAMNCLEDETILIGTTLFVPVESTERDTRTGTCAAEIPAGWGEPVQYEVQVGDNLSRIAERTGTTIEDLKAVNCLNSDTILIGASLLVPAETATE